MGLGFRVEKVESLVRLKDRGGGSAVEDLRSGAMLPAYRKMWGKASGVPRLARVGDLLKPLTTRLPARILALYGFGKFRVSRSSHVSSVEDLGRELIESTPF